MAKDTSYLMGYGSWAVIRLRWGDNAPNTPSSFSANDGIIVPLLSAEYSKSQNVPTATTFHTPLNTSTRSIIRLSSGTSSYSGSISFELTGRLANLIFTQEMMYRRNFLDIMICDGEATIPIVGAVWNSFTISANPNSIVNGSISFSSCNGYRENIQVNNGNSPPDFFDDLPNLAPYWQYGAEGVESFSLSFSRSVNPIYLNEPVWIGPSYLRVGMLEANFQITCWEKWFNHLTLQLGPRKITFNSSAFTSQRSYSFSGLSGNGVKSYTVNALGQYGSNQIFSFG